jgi:transcriptional regulator with GAF, ATPase, and Fis domain
MNSTKPFDERTFVHEATQSLFSSLCIEEALHAFISYLRHYIPLDAINTGVCDSFQKNIRYLAVANNEIGVLVDETVHLSSEAIEDGWKYKIGSVVIDNCVSSSRVVQESLWHFISAGFDVYQNDSADEFSTMTITIGLGKPIYAIYNMVALGKDRYTDVHKERLMLLEQPLKGAILNLVHHRDILSQNEKLKKTNEALLNRLGHTDAKRIIGAETGLRNALDKARQVAVTDSPVLLKGETGTGKELLAHAIHQMSNRSENPIVCINCGAIPESLVDSELFGYEKGAFTGASELKRGYFEQADKGTIFLDEVAELPLSVQVKLLRVLQEKMFYRVGGQRLISVDIRVITATHRDLANMVNQGTFRKDLWFRLNVFPIYLPPLRERLEDIPEMSAHIATLKAKEMNLPFQPRFAPEAMKQLKAYGWPGNIRELQNIIEHKLIISGSSLLSFPDLIRFQTGEPIRKKVSENSDQFKSIHDLISEHIREALRISEGKIYGPGGAAELLGLNPSTLQGKMRKYQIRKNMNGH